MDQNHNNTKEIQIYDLPNEVLNEISEKVDFKDLKTLYFVCKKFRLLLNRNKSILFQLEVLDIKKLKSISRFQSGMLKVLTIKNFTGEICNLERFISLETLLITGCCKANPYIILPPNLKIFKFTSTFLSQDRIHSIVINATYCQTPLEVLELNGTLSEEKKGTGFILIYPFITCLHTISCSNAYMRLAIYNHMQGGNYEFTYENFRYFQCEEKRTIQLCVNNSVNSPIKFVKNLYYPQSWAINTPPNMKTCTLKNRPAIYAFTVRLTEGRSLVLTFVHQDPSISSQTRLYINGQMPQPLPDSVTE